MPTYSRSGTEPHDVVLRAIGARIRDARKSRGLSQEGLAELSSIDRGGISAIENGRIDVRILTLLKIAEALEVPLSSLTED